MNNWCPLLATVVAKINTSPPSFNFSFLRSSATDMGKLRTVILALSIPARTAFNSCLFIEVVFSMIKRRPGKSGISVSETNR